MMGFDNKLLIKNNNQIIYETTNLQPIYLYPLNLKDYVDNIDSKNPIMLNIIKYDKKIDYEHFLSNKYFNKLKCVELLIDKDYFEAEKIINYLYKKNIMVTVNINNLCNIDDEFIKIVFNKVKYFKIFWDYINYDLFKEKLKLISDIKNSDSFILIKGYLNLDNINLYEEYIKDFSKLRVDIYQLSKELIPIGIANIGVPKKYADVIRNLEAKYNDSFKFISVKNLNELYYPRFELDSRNSRNCYACRLKPYLYNNFILPCKVNNVISNLDYWGVEDFNIFKFNKCGIECDDCASIYENDILNEIYNVIKDNNILVELEIR